jgi:ubiquinone/menaquinone biosynthesis C-methylase UbiE
LIVDKYKYDSVVHLALHYCSPLNNEMVDEITDLMKLTPGKHVIDIGCAKSEILIRMANRCQVKAFGIDPSPLFIEASHKQIADRVPAADITLYHTAPAGFTPDPDGYDAAMCINSSELYGSYEHALQEIARMTKPGGMVLMGDYYWRKKPDVELSEFLVNQDYMSAIETGMKQGLTPLFASVCTQVDLDRYIWMQNYSAEQYVLEAANDPDVAPILARVRMMRSLYVEYGRETLGFGLFLFRNPLE